MAVFTIVALQTADYPMAVQLDTGTVRTSMVSIKTRLNQFEDSYRLALLMQCLTQQFTLMMI